MRHCTATFKRSSLGGTERRIAAVAIPSRTAEHGAKSPLKRATLSPPPLPKGGREGGRGGDKGKPLAVAEATDDDANSRFL